MKKHKRLLLTGERRRRRYRCIVEGEEIWLSLGVFTSLVELVFAKLSVGTNVVEMSTVEVFRLRRAFEEAPLVCGRDWIELVGDGDYQFGLSTDEVSWTESFRTLVDVFPTMTETASTDDDETPFGKRNYFEIFQ